jgi:hypothetical protein
VGSKIGADLGWVKTGIIHIRNAYDFGGSLPSAPYVRGMSWTGPSTAAWLQQKYWGFAEPVVQKTIQAAVTRSKK